MSKRTAIFVCAAALLVVTCSNLPQTNINLGSGTEFLPYVTDSIDNVGFGDAVAVSKDGVPFFSYFGVPAVVPKGAIPQTRPIGSPYLPAALVASMTEDGVWTRGAAAQGVPTPAGVSIPYGPDVVPSLRKLTQAQTNGTDIAVGDDGSIHVVWTGPDGVWYAKGGTGSFTAEHVFKQSPPLTTAGAIGAPSVTLDGAGNPSIAFTIDTGKGQAVDVATKSGNTWTRETIALVKPCAGCPPPGRTQIVSAPSGPIVLYVDGAAQAVMAANNDHENGWVSFQVEGGVTGQGLSAAVAKDGTLWAAYYSGAGVNVASSSDGSSWTASKAEDVSDPTAADTQSATTGIAVDDAGTVYLTWFDMSADTVLLASSPDGSSFTPIATRQADGGTQPSVGVAPDGGAVYLVWYDATREANLQGQDLRVGIERSVEGVEVAAPSPTSTTTSQPTVTPPGPTCSPNGTQLQLVAQGSLFDASCLAVDAGAPFKVTVDNKDAFPHDFSIYPSADALTPDQALVYNFSNPIPPSGTLTYSEKPLPAGTYYFQCDFHPTTMFGTFVVAAKK